MVNFRASAAGLLGTCATIATARKFSGVSNGDQWPFLAKFAYGMDKSGGTVGNIKVTWSYPSPTAPSAGLFLFDDVQWSSAYPGSCSNALVNSNQGSIVPLPQDPSFSPITVTVTESTRPHFWYFTLAVPPSCGQGVQMAWSLELTQADGNQLSYDELGLPEAYGCFWAITAALFGLHLWSHYFRGERFAPAIVRWFTASLALYSLTLFCRMIDISTVKSNGVGVPFFAVTGEIFRLLSLMTLWVVAALAANGVGVVTRGINEKGYNWVGYGLLGCILLGYITLAIYAALDLDPRVNVSVGSVWPAITLLILTLAYFAWWGWKTRVTILAEVNTVKRRILWLIACALAGNFWILPFALMVGAATPDYLRARVTTGIDTFLITVLYGALTYVLWPGRAQEAFRSFADATSLAGMLGLDDGLVMDPMLAGQIGDAYAYAAAPELKGGALY